MTTGGTTAFTNPDAAGIYVQGDGPRVINNDVITTVKQGTGTGKYRDNLTFAVTTPFSGGTDAGNNN